MKLGAFPLSSMLNWNLWWLYTVHWTAKHVGSPDCHSQYYVAQYWAQNAHLSLGIVISRMLLPPRDRFPRTLSATLSSKEHLKLASVIIAVCESNLKKLRKAARYRCSKEVLKTLFIKIQYIFSVLSSSSVSMYCPRELNLHTHPYPHTLYS